VLRAVGGENVEALVRPKGFAGKVRARLALRTT